MKKVCVLGKGLLGYHLRWLLDQYGYKQPSYRQIDSLDFTIPSDADEVFKLSKGCTHYVNAAGFSCGITGNLEKPYHSFFENSQIVMQLLSAARSQSHIEKFVTILTSCAYGDTGEILEEKNFLKSEPNPTVAPHGYSKRNAFLTGLYLSRQFNFPAYGFVLNNLYGPRDKFDGTGKVATSLIGKIVRAKVQHLDSITLFGDGTPRRELIYIMDACHQIIKAMEVYDDPSEPLNLGGGSDVTIKELAETIADIADYKGEIQWDTSRPNGQMRKLLGIDKMTRYKIPLPAHSLHEGLKATHDWYINNSEKYLKEYVTKTGEVL